MSAEAVPSSPAWRLRSLARRVVLGVAEVVCPPEIRTGNLVADLLAEFELLLGALPTGLRWLIPGWLLGFRPGCTRVPARAWTEIRPPPGRRGRRLPPGGAGTAPQRARHLSSAHQGTDHHVLLRAA